MASIYSRKGTAQIWIKFAHPHTGEAVRQSLGITDAARARIAAKKIDALCLLARPEVASMALPEGLLLAAGLGLPSTSNAPIAGELPISEIVPRYIAFCRAENSAHHFASKLSILRRFFGSALVPFPEGNGSRPVITPAISATHLSQIDVSVVQRHIDGLSRPAPRRSPRRKRRGPSKDEPPPVSIDTRRHHRSVFLQLWHYAMTSGHLPPQNAHAKNPMAALPSYLETDREVLFLSETDIARQLEILEGDPLHIAVATMIFAGVRRSEALQLRPEDVNLEQEWISLRFRRPVGSDSPISGDKSKRKCGLKTGSRPIPLDPALGRILRDHIAAHPGTRHLCPGPLGRAWDKDNFSERLREANKRHGLIWTCNHYRHTFATRLLRRGTPTFLLARYMGNSVQVIEDHYAGFIPPTREQGFNFPPSPLPPT